MNREQRRAAEKKMGKETSEKLSQKIFQLTNLPDMCLACTKPFDKKSKEMARTWNVVVATEDTVRLYCPECWSSAQEVIKDFKEKIINDNSTTIK